MTTDPHNGIRREPKITLKRSSHVNTWGNTCKEMEILKMDILELERVIPKIKFTGRQEQQKGQ